MEKAKYLLIRDQMELIDEKKKKTGPLSDRCFYHIRNRCFMDIFTYLLYYNSSPAKSKFCQFLGELPTEMT
jgi:hypothetical protein